MLTVSVSAFSRMSAPSVMFDHADSRLRYREVHRLATQGRIIPVSRRCAAMLVDTSNEKPPETALSEVSVITAGPLSSATLISAIVRVASSSH